LRAAVRGILDCSQADLLSVEWWRAWRLKLEGLRREDDLVGAQAALQYHLSLVSNSGLTEESFAAAQERCRSLLHRIYGKLRPWEGLNEDEHDARYRDRLVEEHRRRFGDRSSPEAREQIRRDVERWKAEMEALDARTLEAKEWQEQVAERARQIRARKDSSRRE